MIIPLDERWEQFLNSTNNKNIFHHPNWINNLAKCYNYQPYILCVSDKDGKLTAGLPIIKIKSALTGKRWISLPFSDYCQPLYETEKALEQLKIELVKSLQEDQISNIELRWVYPNISLLQEISDNILHTIKLNENSEFVLDSIQKRVQQYIRSTKKKGVIIERGTTQEQLKQFFQFHLQTRQRHGLPTQPWKFFAGLKENVLDKKLGFISLAKKDNHYLAAMLFLHFGNTLTYKYGASDRRFQNLRPNHLLLWDAIKWGCENGYEIFDLGKSAKSNTGLRRFKSKFGAEEKELIYTTSFGTSSRPKSGRLMNLMGSIIRNFPLFVTKITGKLFYRHLA